MSKKSGILVAFLSFAAIVLSFSALIVVSNKSVKNEAMGTDIQYVLYLGTNDKDTNEPVFPPEQAREEVKKILVRHFGGYTIQERMVDGLTGKSFIRNIRL